MTVKQKMEYAVFVRFRDSDNPEWILIALAVTQSEANLISRDRAHVDNTTTMVLKLKQPINVEVEGLI